MRVLVLTNMWPRPDRPFRGIFTARQVEGIRAAGVTADVIVIEGDRSRRAYLRAAVAILRLNFQERRYDVLHAHTGHCGVLAVLQVRYPVVFSYVGYDLDVPAEDWEGPRTRLERLVFRYLSLFVAGTIAKSRRGRARVPRLGRRRNVLIPNGVDRDAFRPRPRDEARRELGWRPDHPIALFAADETRFTKRFDLAREAVEIARRTVPELELVVAGSTPPGEMPTWMAAADLLLLTSVAEGSPNVVKEAMACDLPVVSVDVGDVRDVIGGARHCHVCSHDAEELARAVVSVVAALPERSDGRLRTEHLGLAPISERLRQTYERAMRRGPGPLGFLAARRASPSHSPQRDGS